MGALPVLAVLVWPGSKGATSAGALPQPLLRAARVRHQRPLGRAHQLARRRLRRHSRHEPSRSTSRAHLAWLHPDAHPRHSSARPAHAGGNADYDQLMPGRVTALVLAGLAPAGSPSYRSWPRIASRRRRTCGTSIRWRRRRPSLNRTCRATRQARRRHREPGMLRGGRPPVRRTAAAACWPSLPLGRPPWRAWLCCCRFCRHGYPRMKRRRHHWSPPSGSRGRQRRHRPCRRRRAPRPRLRRPPRADPGCRTGGDKDRLGAGDRERARAGGRQQDGA
jgi:hypothetical protein